MALTIIKLGTEKENFEPNMILQTRMTICNFWNVNVRNFENGQSPQIEVTLIQLC